MANINWPVNPNLNDQYTSPNGDVWIWNGYAWDNSGISGLNIYNSDGSINEVRTVDLDQNNIIWNNANSYGIRGDKSKAPRFNINLTDSGNPIGPGLSVGVRGTTDTEFSVYGAQGDSFIRGTNGSNGLNILESAGIGTSDYIRFFAGNNATAATPTMIMIGRTEGEATKGNIGINTATPTNQLDINGDLRIRTVTENNALDRILVVDNLGIVHRRDTSTISGTIGATGATGAQGIQGATGERGLPGGLSSYWEYSGNSTNPSAGEFKVSGVFNNGDNWSGVTSIRVAYESSFGQDLTNVLNTIANQNISNFNLRLFITQVDNPNNFIVFDVDFMGDTAFPHYNIAIDNILESNGNIQLGENYQFNFILYGDVGATGPTGIGATGATGPADEATGVTGTNISFEARKVYNSPASPATGNITNDLTGAKIGIVQKIYHNSGTAPTFPAGWVLLGDGIYFTSQLNIIYAEWVTGTRVEYWIIQEQ